MLEENIWVESVFEPLAREDEKGGLVLRGEHRREESIEPLRIIASNTAPLTVAAISAKISPTQRWAENNEGNFLH
jgi:hypothetical protein